MPIRYWSDIDLIIIFKDYNFLLTKFLGDLAKRLDRKYKIRIDINLVYKSDIDLLFRRKKYCSSEIMNALNKRNVKVLYGSLDSIALDEFNEKDAVYTYLNVTMLIFRRYYVENIHNDFDANKCKIYLQRIIRMVFSILRSSLRLLDVFVNPYDDTLTEIKKLNILFPNEQDLLEKIINIRINFDAIDTTDIDMFMNLFSDIEMFVERYVILVFKNFQSLAREV